MTDLSLWDWRRQVADLYAAVRANPDPEAAWRHWRDVRDRLYREHPQTPVEQHVGRKAGPLPFFPYDPALRLTVAMQSISGPDEAFPAGADGELHMVPFARTVGLDSVLGRELTVFWLRGYCGGAFLPFADATSGQDTYGAGRYLLDTIKSADLGLAPDGRTVLDFNFAYNPSCAYSDRYVCPLAPRANRLPAPVRAGEKAPGAAS